MCQVALTVSGRVRARSLSRWAWWVRSDIFISRYLRREAPPFRGALSSALRGSEAQPCRGPTRISCSGGRKSRALVLGLGRYQLVRLLLARRVGQHGVQAGAVPHQIEEGLVRRPVGANVDLLLGSDDGHGIASRGEGFGHNESSQADQGVWFQLAEALVNRPGRGGIAMAI